MLLHFIEVCRHLFTYCSLELRTHCCTISHFFFSHGCCAVDHCPVVGSSLWKALSIGLTFDLYFGVEEEEFMVNSVTVKCPDHHPCADS